MEIQAQCVCVSPLAGEAGILCISTNKPYRFYLEACRAVCME